MKKTMKSTDLTRAEVAVLKDAAENIISHFNLDISEEDMINSLIPIHRKHDIQNYVDVCMDDCVGPETYDEKEYLNLCGLYERTGVSLYFLPEYSAIADAIGHEDPDVLENVLKISRTLEGYYSEDYIVFEKIHRLSEIFGSDDYKKLYKWYCKKSKKLEDKK